MGLSYRCKDCGADYVWPHSLVNGLGFIPQIIQRADENRPRYADTDVLLAIKEWEDRGYRDSKGRWASHPYKIFGIPFAEEELWSSPECSEIMEEEAWQSTARSP